MRSTEEKIEITREKTHLDGTLYIFMISNVT